MIMGLVMSAQVLVILMAVASLLLNTVLWVSEYKAILQRIYVNMVIIHSITQASMGHQIAARMLLFGFGDALTFHAAPTSILFPRDLEVNQSDKQDSRGDFLTHTIFM